MNISDEEYEELESYFQLKLRDKEEQLRYALQSARPHRARPAHQAAAGAQRSAAGAGGGVGEGRQASASQGAGRPPNHGGVWGRPMGGSPTVQPPCDAGCYDASGNTDGLTIREHAS